MEGCPGRVVTRTAMWVQFLHRHVLEIVVIVEEVNFPHPRCGRCNMLVPRWALNGRHPATDQCVRGSDQKRRRIAEAETREISERAFKAYREPIQNVSIFRYLERVLTEGDYDWLAVVGNLGKAWKSWGRLSRNLSREGADPKVSGIFYKAVVQSVFLFAAETWVLTPRMEQDLECFQNRVARRITRKQPWR